MGKSSVVGEIHDLLCERGVPHACLDRDALMHSWPREGRFNEGLTLRNLRAVWANFHAAGARQLVIDGVIERAEDLEGYRAAVPGAVITTCRLRAPEPTRLDRLRSREKGAGLAWHLHRTVELERILDAGRLEDFIVENGDRPLRAVAEEVLVRAGWLEPGRPSTEAGRRPGSA